MAIDGWPDPLHLRQMRLRMALSQLAALIRQPFADITLHTQYFQASLDAIAFWILSFIDSHYFH